MSKDIIISEEMSKRIDRTKLNGNGRSAEGVWVTHESKFAPENAKEIVDRLHANAPKQDGSNQYLVDSSALDGRKYFNNQVENGNGKLIDI